MRAPDCVLNHKDLTVTLMAGCQSGYVADCKSAYLGSIPGPASKFHALRPDGEIGIRKRLKISRSKDHAGSSPAPGTKLIIYNTPQHQKNPRPSGFFCAFLYPGIDHANLA